MKTTEKFKEIASYQGNDFKEWFGDMEFEDNTSKLYSKKLERSMTDSEILAEFKPTELTLGEVFNYLKTVNKKDWMLFYCKDSAGVLRTVGVGWRDDGWGVDAGSVEDPGRWGDGDQVFSRNSFETLDSVTLSPSDSLTIERAIQICKDAGLVVTKTY